MICKKVDMLSVIILQMRCAVLAQVHGSFPPLPSIIYTHRSSFRLPLRGASSPTTPGPHSGTPSGRGTRTGSYSSFPTAAIVNFRLLGARGVPSGTGGEAEEVVASNLESEPEGIKPGLFNLYPRQPAIPLHRSKIPVGTTRRE